MAKLSLPVLADTMTIVEALQSLRAHDSRAGARSLSGGGYEILTAAELARAADHRPDWQAVRVKDVAPTDRVARPEPPRETGGVGRGKTDFIVAPQPGTLGGKPASIITVTASPEAAQSLVGVGRVCRCEEAFHDVPPPTCRYDGSAVDCY
jgi:hypothetical protein